MMDPRRGTETVVREILVPQLREGLAGLGQVCRDADLLVSHVLTYAAPIVAEQARLPWVTAILSPMAFCTAWDPPELAPLPALARLRVLGPRVTGVVLGLLKRAAHGWSAPITALRSELGLPNDADPLWEGQLGSHGVLALFSGQLAAAQPDWPANTTLCGFAFHDADFGRDDDAERVCAFLDAGPPPLVFSLGSSAVYAADGFYEAAGLAAQQLDRRAIFVVGDAAPPRTLTDSALVVRSAALAPLLAGAALAIHAGGVGTGGQALRAGCPQLVVPFSHDQFDNALRVERCGAGRSLSRKSLDAERLAHRCASVLDDPALAERSRAIAKQVRAEDGATTGCDALERVLAQSPSD